MDDDIITYQEFETRETAQKKSPWNALNITE